MSASSHRPTVTGLSRTRGTAVRARCSATAVRPGRHDAPPGPPARRTRDGLHYFTFPRRAKTCRRHRGGHRPFPLLHAPQSVSLRQRQARQAGYRRARSAAASGPTTRGHANDFRRNRANLPFEQQARQPCSRWRDITVASPLRRFAARHAAGPRVPAQPQLTSIVQAGLT